MKAYLYQEFKKPMDPDLFSNAAVFDMLAQVHTFYSDNAKLFIDKALEEQLKYQAACLRGRSDK